MPARTGHSSCWLRSGRGAGCESGYSSISRSDFKTKSSVSVISQIRGRRSIPKPLTSFSEDLQAEMLASPSIFAPRYRSLILSDSVFETILCCRPCNPKHFHFIPTSLHADSSGILCNFTPGLLALKMLSQHRLCRLCNTHPPRNLSIVGYAFNTRFCKCFPENTTFGNKPPTTFRTLRLSSL